MDGKADVFIRLEKGCGLGYLSCEALLRRTVLTRRPMEFGTISDDLVDYLKVPFFSASFSPFQLIERENKNSGHSSTFDFLAPSLGFLIIVVVGLLLYRMSLAVFSMRPFSRCEKSARSSGSQTDLRTKILTLFNLLFLFFNRKLFEGDLNTANVVVRTDDLLYSQEQVLSTRKEFCFVDANSRLNFLKSVSLFDLRFVADL